jgi:hypothetical protein
MTEIAYALRDRTSGKYATGHFCKTDRPLLKARLFGTVEEALAFARKAAEYPAAGDWRADDLEAVPVVLTADG